jgi:hypothetical protein
LAASCAGEVVEDLRRRFDERLAGVADQVAGGEANEVVDGGSVPEVGVVDYSLFVRDGVARLALPISLRIAYLRS